MSHSKKYFKYTAFGLSIKSELKFFELMPLVQLPNEIDVSIAEKTIRDIPRMEKLNDDFYWFASDGYFFMFLGGIGKFEVIGGAEINIERTNNSDPNVHNLYILGTCLGVICHQRGLLPIHGCAIATETGCKIFSGPVGIGKSTLAAAFINSGYKVLADDVSVISISPNQKPVIYPAYPQIKICKDSAIKLEIETNDLTPIDSEKTKYRYPIDEHHYKSHMSVSAIYFLDKHKENNIDISKPKGATKFSLLKGNTYRESLVNDLQVSGSHFNLCAQLINSVPMYLLKRPDNRFQIDSLIKLLESHFA